MKTLFLILVFAAAAQAQTFSWQGMYLSAARTAPITNWQKPKRDDFNVEFTAIIGIKKNYSIQAEIIFPVSGREPLLRLAFARRLF